MTPTSPRSCSGRRARSWVLLRRVTRPRPRAQTAPTRCDSPDPIVDNSAVARLFDELADLLEIAGENPFKTRAYRTFAQTAREHGEALAVLAARGELLALPGVGKAIAA